MIRPAVGEAFGQSSPHREASGSRSRSHLRGSLARHRTATLLAVLVLALVAALVGPLGAQKAHAEDNNPTLYLGTATPTDYINFINRIRELINDGGSTSVPGAGNAYQVNHAQNNNPGYFLQVDIHVEPGTVPSNLNGFVRLQLDRSNLYLLGWWDVHNRYYYLGDRTPSNGERSRMENGKYITSTDVQRVAGENYTDLERVANESRANMTISRPSMNAAALFLYNANSNYTNRDRARGALRMTQLISEAARFRPIRDSNSFAFSWQDGGITTLHPALANQENNWGLLSDRFNWLLRQPPGFRDPHPLTGYRRDQMHSAVAIILTTAVLYAQYVLATSKSR
ncbi:ribosome-inactivating family protein [Streptomyces sp. NPDC090075]|uniref:ribosome-inactivating family protein n=1 Tax=Streptomyces sp. NPDC090075 TaxID=3365937 RepID=UPI00382BF0DA